MKKQNKTVELLVIAVIAVFCAINYDVFIFPNRFAPAGLDGICTIIQDVSGINIGYLALVANIPLLILAYIKLNRDYALKTIVFIVVFSVTSAVLDRFDPHPFQYLTESGTSVALAPVAAGVVRGVLYAVTIKLNGSAGGVDIVAALIKKRFPHYNLMSIIFSLNLCVAVASYFVCGYQLEPVVCGVLYFYVFSYTSSKIQADRKGRVKIEIITPDATEMCTEITNRLLLSATVVNAHGAFSKKENELVVVIAEKRSVPQIKDMLSMYPEAVYFVSAVGEANVHTHY